MPYGKVVSVGIGDTKKRDGVIDAMPTGKKCLDPSHTKDSRGRCKQCLAEWKKDYYARNPEKRPKRRTPGKSRRKPDAELKRARACVDPTHKKNAQGRCATCLAPKQKVYDSVKNGMERYDGYIRKEYCEICFVTPADTGRPLCTDHDHATGYVRGTLCHSCNFLLSLAQDNVVILQNAITYLETPATEHYIGPGPIGPSHHHDRKPRGGWVP